MAVSISDFWKLIVDARLLSADQSRELGESFGQVKGASAQGNAKTLTEWLISKNVISRYQATILLSGRAGPFVYGDFSIYDLRDEVALAGVYKAVHLPTSHPVALRFLSGPAVGTPDGWRRITQLASVACATRHVHLPRFYELADQGRFKFLVFEDLRGRSLAKHLAAAGPLPESDACRMVRQAAIGLAQLHACGRIHGSLALEHLWLLPSGTLKLIHDPLTLPAAINFTDQDTAERLKTQADYLAPEMVRSGQVSVAQTDVYALGCLLYHLLSGHPPFPGGDIQQKLSRHATETPAALDQLGVPPALAQCVAYMMAKDPAARYPLSAAVADALTPFVDPAQLNVAVEQELATVAAYERHIAARPSQPAAQLAAPHRAPATVAPISVVAIAATDSGPTNVSANDSATDTIAQRMRTRATGRSRRAALIAVGSGLALLAVIGGFYALPSGDGSPDDNPYRAERTKNPGRDARVASDRDSSSKRAGQAKSASGDGDPKPTTQVAIGPKIIDAGRPLGPREEPIDDDGTTLWASPTWGAPIRLNYIGIGAQAFLVLRPAELLANPHGALVLDALGPAGKDARTRLEQRLGIGFDAIEQLVIAFYSNDDKPPRTSYVVRFKQAKTAKALAPRWKEAEPAIFGGEKIHAGEQWAYYLPPAEGGKLLSVAPIEIIKDILEQQGQQPVLGQLDRLLRDSDTLRHVTLLVSPQFLFGDGRKIFAGVTDRLRDPLDEFIGDGVRALSLSLHIDQDNAFAELRALGILERKPIDLATDYHRRLRDLREQIEDYLARIDISPHSKKMMRRYPEMLRELAINTRFGVENDQAVLRCYIYAPGAWNIVKATELVLHETGGAVSAASPGPAASKTMTIQEKLRQKISLSFPRDALDHTIESWAAEAGVVAKILGGDLQLEGITKNQSLDLDERDQPAELVLRKILKKANPDGKLVYIIKPEQPGGDPIVMITTLAAASKRGDKLPPGFEKKSN